MESRRKGLSWGKLKGPPSLPWNSPQQERKRLVEQERGTTKVNLWIVEDQERRGVNIWELKLEMVVPVLYALRSLKIENLSLKDNISSLISFSPLLFLFRWYSTAIVITVMITGEELYFTR